MISGQWVAFVMNNWKLREAKHFRVCVAIYHDIKLHGRMHTVSVTRGYECLMLIGTGNSCNLGREGRLVTCSLTHNLNILHTKDIKREKTAKDCLQLQQPIENLNSCFIVLLLLHLLDTLSTNTIQASPFSSHLGRNFSATRRRSKFIFLRVSSNKRDNNYPASSNRLLP